MHEEPTPSFLEPDLVEKISIRATIKPVHKEILDNINSNTSEAIRILIDNYNRYNRIVYFEKYLLTIAIGILIIAVGCIIENIYTSFAFMIVGVIVLLFSLYMYNMGRKRYEHK